MKSDMSAGPNLQSKAQLFHGTFPVNNMILKRIRAINIIRPNTPLYGGGGQRRAFSVQKARQCVPQCILGGVAVLFTVRKHACAPEATP